MIEILWDENESLAEILKMNVVWFLYSMRRKYKF